ncbi:hypothetical protein QTO34_008463 [Cnephaeus nilssonii]|uniref:Uncharacterized protein n=1 Tax=Cnephaeus nilssonii TaxID=3371016 RepID=A0AA40IB66_CNENI|nr:hypothetical protein QTO34_008463 [Eptesicus nilssonii]
MLFTKVLRLQKHTLPEGQPYLHKRRLLLELCLCRLVLSPREYITTIFVPPPSHKSDDENATTHSHSAGHAVVLGLLGEKYGNIRIPGEVEASEFEMILDAAIEAKLETKLLEEWYCRDENSVPAAYYLRPKSEMLKGNKNAMQPSAHAENEKTWQEISDEIKKIFKAAVKLLHEQGKMKHSQAKRYLFSAIEDEFDFALGKQTPAFLKKCVCYIRKIANIERFVKIPEMGKYMDITGTDPRIIRDPEAQEKLIKLRDEFIPTIVASSNLRVYTSVTHCDMKLGYSQEIENHYIEGLANNFTRT